MTPLEIEAKFWITQLEVLRHRALALGGAVAQERGFERNFRFDTPTGSLAAAGELLRLRQAANTTLTFKRSGASFEERQEWEIEVSDFDRACGILDGLGFEEMHRYERYREVIALQDCMLMLDEVPYGCFAEIEGPDLQTIHSACTLLRLHWDNRIRRTYLDMFQTLSKMMDGNPRDATFAAFADQPHIHSGLLNLPPGNEPGGRMTGI